MRSISLLCLLAALVGLAHSAGSRIAAAFPPACYMPLPASHCEGCEDTENPCTMCEDGICKGSLRECTKLHTYAYPMSWGYASTTTPTQVSCYCDFACRPVYPATSCVPNEIGCEKGASTGCSLSTGWTATGVGGCGTWPQ